MAGPDYRSNRRLESREPSGIDQILAVFVNDERQRSKTR